MSEVPNSEKQFENEIIKEHPVGNQEPLFTKDEIVSEVKGFIKAYRSNQIKLNFLDEKQKKEDPLLEMKYFAAGFTIDDNAHKKRGTLRENIATMIDICVGTIEVTTEERWKILCRLHHLVTRLTSFGLIEGKYSGFDVEHSINGLTERVIQLEFKIDKYIKRLHEDLGI